VKVNLLITTSGCQGEALQFQVSEDDVFPFSDTPAQVQPPNAVIIGGSATTQWTAEYLCDGDVGGVCTLGLPEYYFVASLVSDPSVSIKTSVDLIVNPLPADTETPAETGDDDSTDSGDGDSTDILRNLG